MQKKQILIEWKILTYYGNFTWQKESVLVFLHGWMQDWKSFQKILSILEGKHIPYVSLDLPWFWSSQLIHDDMDLDDYAHVTKSFIEKLELKKPILLWHSFGWRICIHLWSSYSNISKIVLLSAAWVQRKMPLHWYIVVKTGKIILSLPGMKTLGKKFREWLSSPDLKNAGKMTKIFRNTIAEDIQDKMKRIKYTTLMIWWKDDDQAPIADAKIIHWHIENSELIILEGTHFIHQEKPEEITDMILEFTRK